MGDIFKNFESKFPEITESDRIETSDDFKCELALYLTEKGMTLGLEGLSITQKLRAFEDKNPETMTDYEKEEFIKLNEELNKISGALKLTTEIMERFLKK